MALVDEGDATATLVLPDGAQWAYTGLHVTDATGRTLPASLTQAAGGIGISVADADAAYPVMIDPFVQRQTLTAADGANFDEFGYSVALSSDGNTALVGAPGRSSMGAAYVFTRGSNGVYSQTQALTDPTGGAPNDYFGYSVALSVDGNTALVGAFGRTSRTGAAYVFTRSSGVYSQTAAFTDPASGANYDDFGSSVALSADGSTALVGAPGRSSTTGAAYVFTRSSGVYSQTPALTATGGASGDFFGRAVALSADGGTALVGANGRSTSTGAAYVFTRSNGVYSQTAALSATGGTSGDFFGTAVALSADGSTALVGAQGHSSSTGAAYVFTRSNGVYSQTATLTATGGAANDQFGSSVALSADGGTALVGANGRSTSTGAAYMFTRSNGVYSQTAAFTDPVGGATNDYFGSNVALSADGGAALVGAYGRSSYTGAAYVFTDAPALSATGGTPQSATVGQSFATSLTVALTDSYGNPVAGVTVTFTAPASGPGGTFGGTATATVVTDANGFATAPAFTANTVTGNYSVTASATTGGGTASTVFSLTNTAGAPASITAISGGNQTAQLGNAFAAPLTVFVQDSHRNAVSGAAVTFAAPTGTNTATATFSSITATTDSSGLASVNATAAGRPGIFSVTASVSGSATPASFTLSDTASESTVLVTGFSPPTGPTAGGNTVTLTGVNFGGATTVTFDTTGASNVTVVNSTTITVTAPAHAAGTVDIIVATNRQTATIHGYTYRDTGNIAPQPGLHPLPGSGGSGGGLPMAQPTRHDDPGGPAPHAAGVPPPLPRRRNRGDIRGGEPPPPCHPRGHPRPPPPCLRVAEMRRWVYSGNLDHDVAPLHRDYVRLRDVRAGFEAGRRRRGRRSYRCLSIRLHRHRVLSHAYFGRIKPRLPGAYIEFPAMPGATKNLAGAAILIYSRHIGGEKAREPPCAERRTLMGATVSQGEKLATKVEHPDAPPCDRHDLASTGRDFLDCRHDVFDGACPPRRGETL